jgi:hypothetical protein
MKLIWSLAKKESKPHSDFVYNMFWISMKMAKELGYEIVLYGTSDAIERLSELCNEIINVDWFDYKMHDDIKMHIWETRTDDYCTIDGDVFLYKKLNIVNSNELYVERTYNTLNNEAIESLKVFNSFNPNKIISEWSYNEISCNTGLVRWGKESEFKKMYIQKYWDFRKWYLINEYDMKETNGLLASIESVSAHFVCENLLYQLANYYGFKFNDFYDDKNNRYVHWAGPNKFVDSKKRFVTDTIMFEIKENTSESIKSIYKRLETNGLPKVFDFD